MKIHFISEKHNSTTVGLAEITKDQESELLSSAIGYENLDKLHPKKKLEFLATRLLMAQCCEELNIDYQGIEKDEHGKPHLVGSTWQISVSHSFPFVACSLHPNLACGIDIESPRIQLLKIKHKYLNADELLHCGEDLEKLCLHWSAKETLYKIYGRKLVIFSEQLFITEIGDNILKGRIIMDELDEVHQLAFEKHDKYYLVYNI